LTRRKKIFLWISAVVVGLLVAIPFAVRSVVDSMMRGEYISEPMGGQWQSELWRSPFQHGSSGVKLYHGRGSSKRFVEELVYQNAYLGRDCVAYETLSGSSGPSCWVACEDRVPLLLVPPGGSNCTVTAEGVTGQREDRSLQFSRADLVARGLHQPHRPGRASPAPLGPS